MRLLPALLLVPSLALAGNEFDAGLKAYQARSFETAKVHFEAYLKTNPSRDLARTLFYLGQLEADGGKSQAYYQTLVTRFPKDTLAARGNLALGQMAYARADYAGARTRFSNVLTQFPTLPVAAESEYWLAISWLVEDKPETARREFFSLIKAFPNSERTEWARLGIGDSYFRQGIYDRALTEYQGCETSFPKGQTLPIVLFQIGQCFEKLGGKEEARSTYQRVIETAPAGYEGLEAKQRLAVMGRAGGGKSASNPITPAPRDTSPVRQDTVFALQNPLKDTATATSSGLFLQVAAFTDPGSGTPLKNRLAQSGYHVQSSTKMVSGRKYYTVLVGPYADQATARAAEQRLKQEEHIAPIWIRN